MVQGGVDFVAGGILQGDDPRTGDATEEGSLGLFGEEGKHEKRETGGADQFEEDAPVGIHHPATFGDRGFCQGASYLFLGDWVGGEFAFLFGGLTGCPSSILGICAALRGAADELFEEEKDERQVDKGGQTIINGPGVGDTDQGEENCHPEAVGDEEALFHGWFQMMRLSRSMARQKAMVRRKRLVRKSLLSWSRKVLTEK